MSRNAAGPVPAEDAARRLFALRQAPVALARSLLTEVVEADARLAWNGDTVALAKPPGAELLLERATFVVVDLETTGLRPGTSAICEIGAVRIRELEPAGEFETLVDPGLRIAPGASRVTGLRNEQLRGAPRPPEAVRRFLDFAGDAVLVAHNARFDLAFLDRETELLTGSRIAAPVVDTVLLARTLLAGRVKGFSLGQLAWWLGTDARPCHRALPDAQATAELLLALIGLAQERGARTVADLGALAATRGAAGCSTSATLPSARRRGPASTSSAAAATRCCTSGGRATCARGCGRTSAATGSGPRSRLRSAPRSGSSGASRLRARGRARGAPPHPRVAPTRQRARLAAGAPRMAQCARQRGGRLENPL